MRLKLSTGLVRSALAGHSVLGLAVAALLYVVAVSGTFTVFYLAFERWEQPGAPEMTEVTPAAVQRAAESALAAFDEPPEYLAIGLPNDEMPRLIVTAGDRMTLAAADGSLFAPVRREWTEFLVYLHLALSLPATVGTPLVGLLGLALIALLLSGLLAHPNLFKDAFALRLGGAPRQRQVDLHNRLGVWASPFHLALALTGAFLGLWSVLMFLVASLSYDGDTGAASASLIGGSPDASHVAAPLVPIDTALINLENVVPQTEASYVILQAPATTAQQLEVGARVPRSLAWAELYYFDDQGNVTGAVGWSNGEAGTQIYGGVHRIHFGNYGGLPVQIAYLLLGLAMCAVVASGVNIWLVKRRMRGLAAVRLERAWTAIVWGAPLAVALSALGNLTLRIPPAPVFWIMLPGLALAAAFTGERAGWSRALRAAAAVTAALVVLAHALRFPGQTFGAASATVNVLWLTFAAAMASSMVPGRRSPAPDTAPVPARGRMT